MRKQLLIILFATLSNYCYSQISFEKGYYINNNENRIECLIKNVDWKNNPTDFQYKVLETDKSKTASLKLVKEFGIYNVSKYVRKTVKIDRSSENINNLSINRNPVFTEEQLFLKVLVEGQANLYLYEEGNFIRFFYSTENSYVEQLIYKSYKRSDGKIGKNNQFRQQLWNALKCSTIKMNTLQNIAYNKRSLLDFFSIYYQCRDADFKLYEENKKRDLFNLTLRPRLNNSSLNIENSSFNSKDVDLGNKVGFGLGIEAEFILPFNKNKWSISIEPTYQSFKAEKTTDVNDVSGRKLITEVKYNSIEIPLSVRHYFFINKNSKIFVNASYVIDFSFESSLEFRRNDGSTLLLLDLNSRDNLAFGIGFKLKDKYGLELRYQAGREVLGEYITWNTDYNTASIIFGYSIF